MNPITWVTEKIVTSVATLVGGMVISKMETETLKSQMQSLNELEEQARKYEADGNPLIAQVLRDNAANLATGTPGQRTAKIEALFQPQDCGTTLVTNPPKKLETSPGKKRRGRPPKTPVVTNQSSNVVSSEKMEDKK